MRCPILLCHYMNALMNKNTQLHEEIEALKKHLSENTAALINIINAVSINNRPLAKVVVRHNVYN